MSGRADVYLTARQAEVLWLVYNGEPQKNIAKTLRLSMKSVSWYMDTIYRKIGLHDRVSAVRWGVANGYLPEILRQRTAAYSGKDERDNNQRKHLRT